MAAFLYYETFVIRELHVYSTLTKDRNVIEVILSTTEVTVRLLHQ